jgi:hypothetical protein
MKKLFTCIWLFVILFTTNVTSQSWNISGNSGTDSLANFIGSTDGRSLHFRVNNIDAGMLRTDGSVYFGLHSGNSNPSGWENIGIGNNCLVQNTSGYYNVALGTEALTANTTGSNNIALGNEALKRNTTGVFNVAIGSEAMWYNTTGTFNVVVGGGALESGTTGYYNTAIGAGALSYANANYNTAVGYNSSYENTSGNANTTMGFYAALWNTVGSGNSNIGYKAAYNSTGSSNTSLGIYALYTNAAGGSNTALGSYSDVSSASLSNSTAIGYAAVVNASNKVRVGNTSITSIGGQVGWSTFSDARIKQNVTQDVPGLTFINALRPVTYNYNVRKEDELLGKRDVTDAEGKYDVEKIKFSGFIAQEVEAAAAQAGYDFSGIDKSGNLLSLRYAEFVVPIVKSVQELAIQNEELKNKNDELEKKMQGLQQLMNECCINHSQGSDLKGAGSMTQQSSAKLYQNNPNPFGETTVIRYELSPKGGNAKIIVRDLNGRTVYEETLRSAVNGEINLTANQLNTGTYTYALTEDGTTIDTKLMVITK